MTASTSLWKFKESSSLSMLKRLHYKHEKWLEKSCQQIQLLSLGIAPSWLMFQDIFPWEVWRRTCTKLWQRILGQRIWRWISTKGLFLSSAHINSCPSLELDTGAATGFLQQEKKAGYSSSGRLLQIAIGF